jgi:hypothetical protein
MNISDYDFVDCLLVSFKSDKLISNIEIITEAYYPARNVSIRKKGLIRILLNSVQTLNIVENNEFELDINRHYDANGNDTKANEIY